MKDDTTQTVGQPEVRDVLTEVLREGACQLLAQAIQAEVAQFLADHAGWRDERGRHQVVRNGSLPERTIQTGIGSVSVQVPRVRDRSGSGKVFHSKLLPPYLRRSRSLEELIPWLYLKGVSTGDFSEALSALLGHDAPGLSASTICRLKEDWKEQWQQWQRRDLRGKHYVYFWVDGLYPEVRLEESSFCLLVIVGADESGRKELVGLWDGERESELSWRELLMDLKRRGLTARPQLAVGDGALGFWKALPQVYGKARGQRCWVHKTRNVLDNLPKKVHAHAKSHLHQIWMAPSKAQAEEAFEVFRQIYGAKYPKAVECLTKDRDALLTFYDFPAEHWLHIRTTNPIESAFATVRLRTAKTRGCLSRETALAMVLQLALSAQKRWHRLNGSELLREVVGGGVFKDGVQVREDAA